MMRMGTGVLLLALVFVTGCRTEAFTKKSILARAETLRASPDYRIGEGDTITITVLGMPEYTVTGAVRPDGKIAFPEHGEIELLGKTPEQVRTELAESFKKSLRLTNPKVYVSVSAFASKNVTVLGEVGRPGRYPYTGQMRVVDLYGLSIGPTLRAAQNRALLFREVDGAMKVYRVHLKDFFNKGDFATNFYVQPGDILWVERHGWAITADSIRTVSEPIRAIFEIVGIGQNSVTTFVGAGVAP